MNNIDAGCALRKQANWGEEKDLTVFEWGPGPGTHIGWSTLKRPGLLLRTFELILMMHHPPA